MAFRFNFLLIISGVLLQMVMSLLFLNIIFSFVNNIAGWTYNQALLIVASYMMVEGLNWALFAELAGIGQAIKLGTLDNLITRPMSTQFLISVWRADPEDWGRVITAVLIFIYAVPGLGLGFSQMAVNGFFYFFMIFFALAITYSITLIFKSLAFWFTDTNSLWMLVNQTIRVSQYPTDIFFHRAVRIIFSTVLPLAFMATIPAKIFLYGFNFWLIASSILLAAIFFFGSRKFWQYALRHYSSASS
jgi:ABC-2 type transport system permease protein